MRSPIQAIVWEIWAANRRSWLVVLAIVPIWGVVCQLFSDNLQHSDAMKGLSFIPTMLTTCLLMSIFNFTETNPRKGFAGFPQRFFTLPIPTWSLVGIPMVCGVLSVVGLYVVWAECVFRPAGIEMLIRWPAVLLAGTVVFYQSIIWCLSGFRIIRLLTLGFVMTYSVAIGMIPFLPPNLRGNWTESRLTLILAGLMVGAFFASVISIGNQRRGGIQGWAWRRELVRRLTDAIPHVQWNLNSPDRALLWMEWRRSGLVLPVAVLFALLLIMGPVSWIAGYGPKATGLAVSWIAISAAAVGAAGKSGASQARFLVVGTRAVAVFVDASDQRQSDCRRQNEVGRHQHTRDLGVSANNHTAVGVSEVRPGKSPRRLGHVSHSLFSHFAMGDSDFHRDRGHAAHLEHARGEHLARLLRPDLVLLHDGQHQHRGVPR